MDVPGGAVLAYSQKPSATFFDASIVSDLLSRPGGADSLVHCLAHARLNLVETDFRLLARGQVT